MCGIFGIISEEGLKIKNVLTKKEFNFFLSHAERRGKDSCGYVSIYNSNISIVKRDKEITSVLNYKKVKETNICFGHSRLITNGLKDNQPVILEDNLVIHNGIVVNADELFGQSKLQRRYGIDSEIILSIFNKYRKDGLSIKNSVEKVLDKCKGTISAVVFSRSDNKLILFSNNGSLYTGERNNSLFFSSEEFPLKTLGCTKISQIYEPVEISLSSFIFSNEVTFKIDETNSRKENIIPSLGILNGKEKLLEFKSHDLKRCTRCILPETMPFIQFDSDGVCNYCNNYVIRNNPKPISELKQILEPYKKKTGNDCIVPFSGSRDSCYGLHLAVKELGMKPVTYTYDWGYVTDLARRNISRFCSELGVENIIVADNISWKRENVQMNIKAWLNNPDLGMVNIFTAGDKHFFRHVQDVKKQTGINIDLWSVNPMEVTHFKAGFLGIPPDFEEDKVYSNGVTKQLKYQKLRFRAMMKSKGYFNRSIWDTLQGEYYRSFTTKKDYYHIFDYWRWDEAECNKVLSYYDWEVASDTDCTWRIGDGTAAFYNYVYFLVAGL